MKDLNQEMRIIIDENFPATERLEPIYDGIIDTEAYAQSRNKVAWILKEPHDEVGEDGRPEGGGWFIADGYKDGTKRLYPMHLTLAQISYCIANKKRVVTKQELDDARMKDLMLYFKALGYLNISKYPAFTRSSDRVIEKIYCEKKNVILRQIEMMNPDIVIYCAGDTLFDRHIKGDFRLNDLKMEWNDTVSFYIDASGKLIIQADHPSSRAVKADYVNGILDAVSRWESGNAAK